MGARARLEKLSQFSHHRRRGRTSRVREMANEKFIRIEFVLAVSQCNEWRLLFLFFLAFYGCLGDDTNGVRVHASNRQAGRQQNHHRRRLRRHYFRQNTQPHTHRTHRVHVAFERNELILRFLRFSIHSTCHAAVSLNTKFLRTHTHSHTANFMIKRAAGFRLRARAHSIEEKKRHQRTNDRTKWKK